MPLFGNIFPGGNHKFDFILKHQNVCGFGFNQAFVESAQFDVRLRRIDLRLVGVGQSEIVT